MTNPSISKHPFVMYFITSMYCFSLVQAALTGDSQILIHVKTAQLDDPDRNLVDWVDQSNNPCNWTGITCEPQKQSVISINLSGLNISGGFPNGFCRIQTLQNLILPNNCLNGTLTSLSLSPCFHLNELNLTSNLFVGNIPELSPEFANLKVLDLSSNNFSGDIPKSYGFLPSLEVLTLNNNLLNGTIPDTLANLHGLTRLELAFNPFQPGPLLENIGNLTKLRNLFLANTNRIGQIPDSIGSLVSLINLDLSGNSLTGKIPDTISGLENIKQIELYCNCLAGELPESISNLTTLLRFDASQNNLTGQLSEKIAGMKLLSLNLNDNYFTGQLPQVLALNDKLVQLKLFNNSFSGPLPSDLGRYSPLEDFDVSTNGFTGELPPFLCNGKSLQHIVAFKNRFSGSLPESYGNCTSLNYVRLGENQLTGPVLDRFWGLPQLRFLELTDNKFVGPVSSLISNSKDLAQLLIAGNSFSGGLPEEICSLKELTIINLSQNRFSGEVPACITELKNLQTLDLQENSFSGEIPASVSSWTELVELNLSGNRFTGNIPTGLGNLPVLTYLDLSSNSLTGDIPAELTKLKLNEFNVSGNKLSGKVPFGFDDELYVMGLLGNPNLCSPDLKPLSPCRKHKPVTVYVVFGFLFLVLLGSLFWFFKSKSVFLKGPKCPYKVTVFQKVWFSAEDVLEKLTKENLIGSGGSGQVYRVDFKVGPSVAGKRLWEGGNSLNPEMESAFRSELETLGRVRHGNIVKLLMCCSGERFRVLVYEYMEKGSLGDVLHGEKCGILLDWSKRFEIAVGAAQGLAYLHHDCVPAIVHRDVKSNNILLDNKMRPRVADFGLAKALQQEVAEGEGECAMSRIAGSYGYIAPEYAYTLKVNEKSDVYSFGVVLMELVTGRRPNDSSFGDNEDLVKWVNQAALSSSPDSKSGISSGCFKDLNQLIDPRMDRSTCDDADIERVLNVALTCTSAFPINRPSMRRVVELLKDQKPVRPR